MELSPFSYYIWERRDDFITINRADDKYMTQSQAVKLASVVVQLLVHALSVAD